MTTVFALAASSKARLRGAFVIGLVTAAALHGLASIPAEARPKTETGRPPALRPPIPAPPRTGIEGARRSRATVEEEEAERLGARWAKILVQLSKYTPKLNRTTYKWGFPSANETFNSTFALNLSLWAMTDVALELKDCDVKGAKKVFKRANSEFKKFWHGKGNKKGSDRIYGTSKVGKAEAKADEAAHRNVLDKLWREIKKAEAICLEAEKSKSAGKK